MTGGYRGWKWIEILGGFIRIGRGRLAGYVYQRYRHVGRTNVWGDWIFGGMGDVRNIAFRVGGVPSKALQPPSTSR